MLCCWGRYESPEPQARRRHRRHEHRRHHQQHEPHGQQEPQGQQQYEGQQLYQEGYGQQGDPRYQGHQHNDEYELYNIRNQGVKTLEDAGYKVSDPFKERYPWAGKDVWLHDVIHPGPTGDNVIARLGVWDKPGQLVIQRIYRINDRRPDDSKPHANEVVLRFWGLFLGRDITSIRSLFFCDVQNDSLKKAKERVYAEMGNIDSRRSLVIRGGQTGIEEAQYNGLYYGTKFGRIARRIVEDNDFMRRAGLRVIEFRFLAIAHQYYEDENSEDSGGEDENDDYHFEIILG
ncbi:hypothetical protein INS49_002819 [Diaporthe citri]|uniref:uncharacterized protein n=1 Tax=Diaporthe citri TaxID=83186 RepID=UPI001C8148DA|nr:uncharacterized protein INS49_002819 [Diaporthe citri]KAG6368606.1 hypothetical protein INS49_002819 [Diaporthe citri]